MSNQPQSSAGVTWQVTSQTETMAPDRSGKWVNGWRVEFRLSTGQSGSVFVPLSEYTPETVARVVTDYARQVHSTGQLSGRL